MTRPAANMSTIRANIRPFDGTHDLYQRYYRESLRAYAKSQRYRFAEDGAWPIRILRLLSRAKTSHKLKEAFNRFGYQAFMDSIAHRAFGVDVEPASLVGQYSLSERGVTAHFAVDPYDSGDIASPSAVLESGCYFKTNYWREHRYEPSVKPLPNANPLVLSSIPHLRRQRAAPKEYDLFAFFRVYGGRDELEGVEHNLRLLEALSRLKCRKFLLAYLVTGDVADAKRRLDKVGVPSTLEPMPLAQLWRLSASARLNIVRNGMHQCVPWRMTDTLAMGGCAVMDFSPRTIWPNGFREGVHYLALKRPFECPERGESDAETADRIMGWLADVDLTAGVRSAAAQYFDDHLAPERLGAYMIDVVREASRRPA